MNAEQMVDQFTEKMGFLGTLFGFSQLVGQIYGILYLSPDPVSLDELTERLHVSKGSISTNIRELEKWGGCKRVWVKGERKDYYTAETDFKSMVNKRLLDAVKRRLNTLEEATDEAEASLKKVSPDQAFYTERIAKIRKIGKKLQMMVKTGAAFL